MEPGIFPVQKQDRLPEPGLGWADDQGAEVERLVSLGAKHVDWDMYPDDPDFVVLEDPDGNRFCVIDKSPR